MFRRVDAGTAVQNPEEKSWQRKALGIADISEYTEEDILDYETLEVISKLFGLYQEQKIPKFHSHYFVPRHGNFENTE